MPIPTKPIDPAMRSWAEQRVKAARETLRCTCGYDLRATGHCGCGKVFQICLGCHLPTRLSRCICKVKQRNAEYPEEWM